MKSHKISLKLYARSGAVPPAGALVETWHAWIRDGVLPETMIDVVDYGHVHQGPAVLFVGHESDYALDHGEGRAGLLYVRKRVVGDEPEGRLDDALRRVLHVASLLEAQCAPAAFERTEVLLRVLDRLRAPNEEATFTDERATIEAAFVRALGGGVTIERDGQDLREPFTVRVRRR